MTTIQKNPNNTVEEQKYRMVLKACKMAGGDIKLYQKLNFSLPQLLEILKGLETKVDVNYYLDPNLSAQHMAILRKGLEGGISLKVWLQQGFDWQQLEQIYLGYKADLPIEHFSFLEYNGEQMEQIRLGLLQHLDTTIYESPDFSSQKMLEIRKGLQKGLDVSKYAKKEYDSIMMREIRCALQDHFNIEPYLERGYHSKVLRQLRKSEEWGYDIHPFVDKGYSADQIEQIGMCLQQHIDITPYLTLHTTPKQLREIRLGFESGVDVSLYANNKFNAEQMEQIRLGLEEKLEVSVYADPSISSDIMESTREKLLFAKESANFMTDVLALSETEIQASLHAEVESQETITNNGANEETMPICKTSVSLASDAMSATLNLAPPENGSYTLEEIVTLLSEQNIRQGLNLSSIQMMLKKQLYGEDVVVARGKEAVNGANGFFTYHFSLEKKTNKPIILPDGSADYCNNFKYEYATEGTLLAEYTPATPGEYGYTVTGKLMIPKRGKDLPQLRGKGFRVSEDKKSYYATQDGQISLENNVLNIVSCLSISKDLDLSVGNIDYNGNVEIMGNVIPNMTIRASGYVKVNGYVESASIYAGGDVVLAKGIQGGGVSYIESGGSVFAPFFESTTIRCEGSLNGNYILNCDISCNDRVLLSGKHGLILGGTTRALYYIDAKTVGNQAELPTKLILGVDTEVIKHCGVLMQNISKIKLEVLALKKNMVIYEEQAQTEHNTYKKLQKAVEIKTEELAKQTAELQKNNATIEIAARSFAGFFSHVYPGTTIYINSEKHTVTEEQKHILFRLRNKKIIMEEYYEPKE